MSFLPWLRIRQIPLTYLWMAFPRKRIRGSKHIFFEDPWFCSIPLKRRFLRLLTICDYLKGSVGEISWWVYEILTWDFNWRKLFFIHKEPTITNFLVFIQGYIFPWIMIDGFGSFQRTTFFGVLYISCFVGYF